MMTYWVQHTIQHHTTCCVMLCEVVTPREDHATLYNMLCYAVWCWYIEAHTCPYIGVMFRYSDANNFYRFSMDKQVETPFLSHTHTHTRTHTNTHTHTRTTPPPSASLYHARTHTHTYRNAYTPYICPHNAHHSHPHNVHISGPGAAAASRQVCGRGVHPTCMVVCVCVSGVFTLLAWS
jgi:hypothetical protein